MTAKIKLNAASGGGSFSLQAPSSSSNNRVITLPDLADGTLVTSESTLDATKLSGNLPALNGSALTNLPASGKILQVIHAFTTTFFSTTSSTLADIGLSASITPSSSSNKVLAFGNIGGIETSGDNYGQGAFLRDSTTIIADLDRGIGFTGDSTRQFTNAPFFILDSPSSTSSLTYKLQFRIPAGGGTITTQTNGSRSTITLMEVAA